MICVPDEIDRDEIGWTLHWPCMEPEHTVIDPCEAMRIHVCPIAGDGAGVFGENLRKRRLAIGWTQAQVSVRMCTLGFKWWKSTVSLIERGLRFPQPDEGAALARAMGVPIAALYESPSIPSDIDEGPTPSLVSVAGKRTGRRNAKVTAPCLPPKQPNDKGTP